MALDGVRTGREDRRARLAGSAAGLPANYKWMALFISTLGMLMATIDGSIVLISLPDIFRGIGIDPLEPGNTFYLLWMILGFLVVTSVTVVSLGRMGDIYGRVRTYNLGFAVFTFFSLLLSITWMTGHGAARLADRHAPLPRGGRGHADGQLGCHPHRRVPEQPTGDGPRGQPGRGASGTFIGLVLGGILAPINWRLIFLVSVPIGLLGTVIGYLKLRETSPRRPARIDWPGNITFAVGLVLVMVGITYGIEPYGRHAMGWTNPMVISALVDRRGAAGRLLRDRDQGGGAHVPPPAVQDQGLHQRRAGQFSGRPEPGWADVHADHLAPGDLAAVARLRLQRHPVVGGHRHGAAHRRVPGRRAHRGHPLRPLRSPPLRHRWHVGHRGCASPCSSCCRSTSPTGCSASCCSSPA